jgi:hypothetical protein
MRKLGYFAAIATLTALPVATWAGAAQQGSSSSANSQSQNSGTNSSSAQTQSATPAPASNEDPLVAASRKAKEAKEQKAQQQAGKPAKVFTNENLPSSGVSSVGATADSSDSSSTNASASTAPAGQGEKYWRDKFASLNAKLKQDQDELDVMQRELGVLNVQNYNDPVQAMQQGLTRGDINKKTSDIDAKQKAVADDKQAIEDAQDALRKSGGDAGWGR